MEGDLSLAAFQEQVAASRKNQCSECQFWHPWRTIVPMPMDGSIQPSIGMGHCVIQEEIGLSAIRTTIQGLTGEDFYCRAFRGKPVTSEEISS